MKLSFEGPEMSIIVRNDSHFERGPLRSSAAGGAQNRLAAGEWRADSAPNNFTR
jgi:hypothetical protein